MFIASEANEVGLLRNLFLAAVPLFWSHIFQWAIMNNRPIATITSFLLWLLFLPNAPYMVTDLIHLAPRAHVPIWFLLAMFMTCASTGVFLGYQSLLTVQHVIEHRFNKTAGWSVAVSSLMLCGYGIYLGRILRLNSWDAFVNPNYSIGVIAANLNTFPHPLEITLVFGFSLIIGYLALRSIATPICNES